MKLPLKPASFQALFEASIMQGAALAARIFRVSPEVDDKGRYLHWDKLRHLSPSQV